MSLVRVVSGVPDTLHKLYPPPAAYVLELPPPPPSPPPVVLGRPSYVLWGSECFEDLPGTEPTCVCSTGCESFHGSSGGRRLP